VNGTAEQRLALPEGRLASEEISDGRREECATPSTARMAQILLPPLHIKLGLMRIFVKAMDQTGLAFKYLAKKFPQVSKEKIKERVLWVLRSASSSETICLTTYFRVTRKNLGTRFVWCQLTSLGISGQKTTRN